MGTLVCGKVIGGKPMVKVWFDGEYLWYGLCEFYKRGYGQ